MSAVLAAAGAVVIALTLLDMLWTTMAAGSGAGPLIGRLADGAWRLALRRHRRRPSHGFLAVAGVSTVLVVFAAWIVLVLAGWTLVFGHADGAVRSSTTSAPGDLVDRLYFVGYSVFTLGNGDLRPGAGAWQLATVLMSGTGLVLVTLGITYLVPVASAVAQRRQLGSYISALGSGPHDIVVRSWDGSGFGSLSQHLTNLAPMLHSLRQQHLTYPVLHYFHSRERESAAAAGVTDLAQALHLLRHGVAEGSRPDPSALLVAEASVDGFLETSRGSHVSIRAPLPLPPLGPLLEAGIPTVDEDQYRDAEEMTEHRRAMLAGLLAEDGWSAG